ncbi:MAG: (2Fe-2S)-binding protein [Planctomycetota bacterium]
MLEPSRSSSHGATVRVTLDGALVEARAGMNLAAWLLERALATSSAPRPAEPVTRVSVCGEPRAPLCGMGTCFECRVTLDGQPHVRACMERCREGMDVRTTPQGGAHA